jgi:exodeoxyribonuclease-3
MRIATWNVNSVKVRLPNLLAWLAARQPDVALLQEIKVTDDAFPALEIGDLGYNIATSGQRTYNGVAVLSKFPLEDVRRGLPGDDGDAQARYVEAVTNGVRIGSIYLPNGNPIGTDKFAYKLAWMDRLAAHAQALLAHEERVVLAGDYNVCPTDFDCCDPGAFAMDAVCQPESRARFRTILNLGYIEAYRELHPGQVAWTYWDYQAGAWEKDRGIRIDHMLLSPQAADRLLACGIDRDERGKPKPSDHTPVWCELADRPIDPTPFDPL